MTHMEVVDVSSKSYINSQPINKTNIQQNRVGSHIVKMSLYLWNRLPLEVHNSKGLMGAHRNPNHDIRSKMSKKNIAQMLENK